MSFELIEAILNSLIYAFLWYFWGWTLPSYINPRSICFINLWNKYWVLIQYIIEFIWSLFEVVTVNTSILQQILAHFHNWINGRTIYGKRKFSFLLINSQITHFRYSWAWLCLFEEIVINDHNSQARNSTIFLSMGISHTHSIPIYWFCDKTGWAIIKQRYSWLIWKFFIWIL